MRRSGIRTLTTIPGTGGGGGGGGGALIFSYKRRLAFFFFGGVKILNFNILGGFRKINIFRGMKILWIRFGGHHKIGLYLGVISMHFTVFS